MMCLVDEAHGTHLYFHEELPVSAMEAGAFSDKLTLEEFEEALLKRGELHRPGRIFVKQYQLYEMILRKAYKEYLELLENN